MSSVTRSLLGSPPWCTLVEEESNEKTWTGSGFLGSSSRCCETPRQVNRYLMSVLSGQDLDAVRDGKAESNRDPGLRKLRVMQVHMKLKDT